MGENARDGASAASTWFNAPATAAAVSFSPFWNLTPSRIAISHSVGVTCLQLLASAGASFLSKSMCASASRHPALVSTNASSVSSAQPAVGPNGSATMIFPPAASAEPAPVVNDTSNPIRAPPASRMAFDS